MPTFSINANLLKGVAMFHGKDSARPAIYGVAVWLDHDGIVSHVVATDSYQMVMAERRASGTAWTAPDRQPDVFIPGELIAKAPKVTKSWPYLRVQTTDTGDVSISNGEVTAVAKQVDTKYPLVGNLVFSKDAIVQRGEGWDAIGFSAKFMERTGKAVNTVFGNSSETSIRFLGNPNNGGKFSQTFWEATNTADGDQHDMGLGVWSLLILWMPVRFS